MNLWTCQTPKSFLSAINRCGLHLRSRRTARHGSFFSEHYSLTTASRTRELNLSSSTAWNSSRGFPPVSRLSSHFFCEPRATLSWMHSARFTSSSLFYPFSLHMGLRSQVLLRRTRSCLRPTVITSPLHKLPGPPLLSAIERGAVCSSLACPDEGRVTCHSPLVLQQCPRSIREFQTRIAHQSPALSFAAFFRGAHKKDSHK